MTSVLVLGQQQPCLSTDNVTVRNLQAAVFKLSVELTADTVLSIASYQQLIFISVAHHGLNVYRVDGSSVIYVGQVGDQGISCYDLTATCKHLVYTVQEKNEQKSICVHEMTSFVGNKVTVSGHSLLQSRHAPFTILSTLGLLVIGGIAWTSSWMSHTTDNMQLTGVDERHVVVLDIDSFQVVAHWPAVEHSVSLLQSQTYGGHCMLGVADSRSGINVYSFASRSELIANKKSPTCLHYIDVDEVRHFELVGACVAVFHRFEPNISFWNVVEQRTILCINVQDQTRQLSEEFTQGSASNDDDDVEECCVFIDDNDDYVTSVTSLPIDEGSDYLLVYGTVSGCVFGMSVHRRTKLFSIPFPHTDLQTLSGCAVQGVAFLPMGQVVVAYQGRTDLTVMNFGVDNPPDRPPTRCHKRTK